jgi:hypothetical protein
MVNFDKANYPDYELCAELENQNFPKTEAHWNNTLTRPDISIDWYSK